MSFLAFSSQLPKHPASFESRAPFYANLGESFRGFPGIQTIFEWIEILEFPPKFKDLKAPRFPFNFSVAFFEKIFQFASIAESREVSPSHTFVPDNDIAFSKPHS